MRVWTTRARLKAPTINCNIGKLGVLVKRGVGAGVYLFF